MGGHQGFGGVAGLSRGSWALRELGCMWVSGLQGVGAHVTGGMGN